jgi:hypothetical protein
MGELVGYDGFKHRKETKIHVCVNKDSMPLSIVIGIGLYGKMRSAVEGFFRWLKSLGG